jgi:hypothetical protein
MLPHPLLSGGTVPLHENLLNRIRCPRHRRIKVPSFFNRARTRTRET